MEVLFIPKCVDFPGYSNLVPFIISEGTGLLAKFFLVWSFKFYSLTIKNNYCLAANVIHIRSTDLANRVR